METETFSFWEKYWKGKPAPLSDFIKGSVIHSNMEALAAESKESLKSLLDKTIPPADAVFETVNDYADFAIEYNSYSFVYNKDLCSEFEAELKAASESRRLSYELSVKSKNLPGVNDTIMAPCECPKRPDRVNYASVAFDGCGCGVCKPVSIWKEPQPVGAIIMHLNDTHRWTREAIADWLDKEADAGNINIDFPTPEPKALTQSTQE